MTKTLFAINPGLDRASHAAEFAASGRVQVRDVLTTEAAREIRRLLASATRFGVAAQGQDGEADEGPRRVSGKEITTQSGKQRMRDLAQDAYRAAGKGDYAFLYAQYSLVEDVQQAGGATTPHGILLEHLNAPEFLGLVRDVTGIAELVKADAQATLYAPQHFLSRHIDSHVAEGWRVAYVLNLAPDDWHPDWGGYLNFYDEEGDIVHGYRPRFNALNLFAVPRPHAVSYVPPFAPVGRFAITGWLRDK